MYIKSGDLVKYGDTLYTVALVSGGTFYLRRGNSRRLKAVRNASELEKTVVKYRNVFFCPVTQKYYSGPDHNSYRSATRVGQKYHKYLATVEV